MRRLVCGALVGLACLAFAPGAMAGEFALRSFEVSATNADGSPDVQAGSHPYELTTSFTLNGSEEVAPEQFRSAGGDVKDVKVELPPGFVGDPEAMPKCTYEEFKAHACATDTAVGTAFTELSDTHDPETYTYPGAVYNLDPPEGIPAEFAYEVAETVPIFLDVSVRTGGDYGLTVNVNNIPQIDQVYASKVTIWGVPAESSHNSLRGACLDTETSGPVSLGVCPVSVPLRPLLTNPTSCGVPRVARINADSWRAPGNFVSGEGVVSRSAALPVLSGCERLDFSPSISVSPDGVAGSTPTGLDVDVRVPQESTVNPEGLAEADVRDQNVALPAGVQLSPSAADGLLACSEEQLGREEVGGVLRVGVHTGAPVTCPDASKVGNVEIKTPLLPEPLVGSLYLASPQNFQGALQNPFGSLLALYLVAEDKQAGVLVKLPGRVTPDAVTGQLVTTFEETPQLPFEEAKLEFYGTDRAPLTTPAACGTYTTQAAFDPWSGTPAVTPTSKFQITSGPGGAPCSSPAPFAPGFVAGTTNVQAGAFTPLTLTMSRPDGDEALGGIRLQMPPGLLGTLSTVKLCPEPQASQGTCGPESLIGETVISTGLGNDPFTVTGGKVYITGPYKGAPYGLSIVNPAQAGPFVLDEGRPVIVRAAVSVDPHTAALTITSDPLPTILDGIPLQIQHVNVTINRPGFMFNPTSCAPMAITGTLSSSEGATAAVSTPFQVTNCASLAFKPAFSASTKGQASKAGGASLDVKLTYPTGTGYTNLRAVKVDLPKQLTPRLIPTLQEACTTAQFAANPAGCPAASNVGVVRATTPLLPVPLSGPAYFVSHAGEEFPSLIIVLQGYGTSVDLVGATYIAKSGVTSSTFKTVPDVPVSSFELYLPQGKHSALAANLPESAHYDLCGRKLAMPTAFIAQNGTEIHQSTPVAVTGCPTTNKATSARNKHKARTSRHATTAHHRSSR